MAERRPLALAVRDRHPWVMCDGCGRLGLVRGAWGHPVRLHVQAHRDAVAWAALAPASLELVPVKQVCGRWHLLIWHSARVIATHIAARGASSQPHARWHLLIWHSARAIATHIAARGAPSKPQAAHAVTKRWCITQAIDAGGYWSTRSLGSKLNLDTHRSGGGRASARRRHCYNHPKTAGFPPFRRTVANLRLSSTPDRRPWAL